MNHPNDLLVDLVDDSISPQDRAVVEAHLASCARCRHEVYLAAAGRDALRSLPAPAVPPGLGDAAITEAGQHAREVAPEVAPLRGRGGRAEVPAWYRWAGAAAAAAAILLVVVVALPDVGGDDRTGTTEATDAGAEFVPEAATGLEVQDLDYDTAAVQALALAYGSVDGRAQPNAEFTTGAADPVADPQGFDDALACLRQAEPTLRAQAPVQVIDARFEGAQAYLGVFLSGPGADQPSNRVTVWIADRDSCQMIHSTTAEL